MTVTRLSLDARRAPAATEAERRTRELETLHALSRAIAELLGERDVVERALQTVVDMGWFACGEAFLHGPAGLEPVAVGLCPYERVEACPLRSELQIDVEAVLREGHPRHDGTWHLVPIGGRALLALSGARDVSPSFLANVTELVAGALKRTQLHDRLAEKEAQRSRLLQALLTAQEEERGRISRDLHDQIGQALTALLLGLDRNLEHPDPASLARLKELASITLGDVRRIALDLRPSVLDELGLEAAVRRYARDVHERYGLDVAVLVTLPTRLPRQEETVLYRAVQEALTNVVRHAKATSVSVVATKGGSSVRLVIEDDGVGFDPDALAPAEMIGLLGMRERLELLGGSLRIESAPGAGCTVHARLPVR
ncbi:MAG: sensor histidine kinase [Trueperaceae bacterium]|nr:sensor histidine kinase [Trueperaceae bacterium]